MFESLVSLFTGGFVKDVGDAIDKNVTSDQERLALRNELAKIVADSESKAQEFSDKYESQLTERLKADTQSDDKLAKRVRPMSLVFLLAVVSMMAIFDGNISAFMVKPYYIQLFESLLMLAFGFYFGGRSLEKIASLVAGKWKK